MSGRGLEGVIRCLEGIRIVSDFWKVSEGVWKVSGMGLRKESGRCLEVVWNKTHDLISIGRKGPIYVWKVYEKCLKVV